MRLVRVRLLISSLTIACAAAAMFAACGSDDDNTVTPAKTAFSVTCDETARELVLRRDATVLLRLPSDGLQLGRVDALDEDVNYDPYPMAIKDETFTEPRGLRWLSVVSATVTRSGDGEYDIDLVYDENVQATLAITTTGEGNYKVVWTPLPGGTDIAYFRLRPRVSADDAFYGLGGFLDTVNQRGKIRAMQLVPEGNVESRYNEAHVPVPFITGTTGWGLFVESPYPASFAVATEADDLMDVIFGTGFFSVDGLTFHLFAAKHPMDITKKYYDVTGYPKLPGRWGLGPIIWRDENDDQAQVVSDANIMRDKDLPASGYWIDRPYATGVNSFDFDARKFDDPQTMIDTLHGLGFRISLWHTPYVSAEQPGASELNAIAEEKGYFPSRTGLLLNNWSKPIDFTNPEAYSWWQGLIKRYMDMGIEGFKLDFAEDVVPGVLGVRTVWEFADGSDERSMHSQYTAWYHKVYTEMLPQTGGFLICRAGTYGDQTHVTAIWPGDLDANMAYHREEMEERDGDKYDAVGGLPASLMYGLTLGPSGFPLYGADTGGYRHSPPDKETFTRWFQQTALSSVMQIGTSSNDVAWEYNNDNGFDDEMLDWYRIYTRLHLRLWPYEWTYAQNITETGHPIDRALGFAHPELGVHPNDTYLFGDYLLVAPVVRPGVTSRDIVLPAGKWIDWWDGSEYDGGQTITMNAPLSKLPLLFKRGGIVPLLRPTIDTMAPTTATDRVDSYDTTPGVLYPRVAAGEASEFVLFDGTVLRQEATANGVNLYAKDGDEFTGGYLFEVMAFGDKPSSVKDNDTALTEAQNLELLEAEGNGWYYDAQNSGAVYVKIAGGEHTIDITK